MEEPLSTPGTVTALSRDCANCGQPEMEGGHPTPLCPDCRQQFTRLSIPLWIKLFAGGVCALLLFGLFTLPRSLSLGIALKKAEKAEAAKNYMTAQRELEQFLKSMPNNREAQGHLLIVAFHNMDLKTFGETYEKLRNMDLGDKDLVSDIDRVMDKAANYISNDSFEIFQQTHADPVSLTDTAWSGYFDRNPSDIHARMLYASLLFDRQNYTSCDSVLQLILKKDDEYFTALLMEASLNRELGNYDRALQYNEKLLAFNKESVMGLGSEARTLLRQKKDEQALKMATEAYRLDPGSCYVQATLILAYHYNHRPKDKDVLIKKALAERKDGNDSSQVQYALDVLSKKEKFRD